MKYCDFRSNLRSNYLVNNADFFIRGVWHRDVLSPLDIQGLELVCQLLHVSDSDGNVGNNQVIIAVNSWTSLDQVKVQVAHAQPCAMPKNMIIVNFYDFSTVEIFISYDF